MIDGLKTLAATAMAVWLVAAPARAGIEEDFDAAVRLAEQGRYTEAVSALRLVAQQGHAGAQYNLGFLYDMGWGVEQDFYAAFNWYSQAADRGLAQAQYNIGVMYYLGRGVDQNLATAADWYRRAAEGGLAEAQTNLGYFYETGQGLRQDYVEAVRWYTLAAEQGSEKAQFNLAYMFVKGLGTTQNVVEAYKWFSLAATRGHQEAEKNRGLVAQAMTAEQRAAGDAAVQAYLAANPLFAAPRQ